MIDIIMLPYAGSIGYAYQKIITYFDKTKYCIHMMDLDGRGDRLDYPVCEDWDSLVEGMFKRISEIVRKNNRKYVLFGHSMGAKIVYDIYSYIAKSSLRNPQCIFFSGCKAHDEDTDYLKMYQLPEGEFKKEYVKLGGIPTEVLKDRDFREIIFQAIREDLKLLIQYKNKKKRPKITEPVIVLNGEQDKSSAEGKWKKLCNSMIYKTYSGNHFFIFQSGKEVVRDMCRLIENIDKNRLLVQYE